MSKYIVKNCPCYTSKGGYYDCWANQDTWCENVTDCVTKQVIDYCLDQNLKYDTTACDILDLFDIEEVE